MFGNRDIGMHTGRPWIPPVREPGPDLCVIFDCALPEAAPVHHRSYAESGHQFLSELMAEAQDDAEGNAEAAYDAAMED